MDGSVFESAIKNFLSPIWDLLKDESVTEVMVNSFNEIWVERAGKIEKVSHKFQDEDSLRAVANNIAQSVGRQIGDENPRLDARLPNGYRIHVVIPPCARKGTTMAIRKFSKTQFTFQDFIRYGSMSVEMAQFIDICVKLGKNIIVSGGTGSGKTTLLSMICNRIPKGQRLIVIEDSSELQIEYEHIVFFETRMANPDEGLSAVTIEELVKSSLRLRPDRIIIGEVRGSEALDLVQAMNTGHKGCFGTLHANTPKAAMVRLQALAQGADSQLSEKALIQQISSAVDIVIQTSRYQDGVRRIASISEVLGKDERDQYIVKDIYHLDRLIRQEDGGFSGIATATGHVPSFMAEIEDHKLPFSRQKFLKKKAS
ncbi:MAG: CpaF family protein [Bdellovibrionales bacterium]|nr:CpaF family protein [Bdellovibrionales bacterium]